MGNLILPNEPRELILPKTSRRGFMGVLGGLIAAPMIVPVTNLMQIHSIENRLIVAYQGDIELIPSLLNLGDYSPEVLAAWRWYNNKEYTLVRLAEIQEKTRTCHGGIGYGQVDRPPREFLIKERELIMASALRYYASSSSNGIIKPT